MTNSYLMALARVADLRVEAEAAVRRGELLRAAAQPAPRHGIRHRLVTRRRAPAVPAQRRAAPVPAPRHDAPAVPAQRRAADAKRASQGTVSGEANRRRAASDGDAA